MEDDLDQVKLEVHVRQTRPEVSAQEQLNHPVRAVLQVSAGFPWARLTQVRMIYCSATIQQTLEGPPFLSRFP